MNPHRQSFEGLLLTRGETATFAPDAGTPVEGLAVVVQRGAERTGEFNQVVPYRAEILMSMESYDALDPKPLRGDEFEVTASDCEDQVGDKFRVADRPITNGGAFYRILCN